MKPSFIYSDNYTLDWPEHVFPVEKYRLVHRKLIEENLLRAEDFIKPQSPPPEQILLVHDKPYIERFESYAKDPNAAYWEFEIPISRNVIDAVMVSTGGTILAGREALKNGAALNLGGGFHHAFADHGEGFCFVNDVAVAIRGLQRGGLIKRGVGGGWDLHQGNGTAHIFRDDPDVFTLSIHQERNYPVKQKSDLDIGLDDFTGDEEYLNHLDRRLPGILDTHKPDLVFYLAGADPYRGDRLGQLSLTIEGLKKRDELILGLLKDKHIPVAVVLAGGYAERTEDVVEIHVNTAKCLIG